MAETDDKLLRGGLVATLRDWIKGKLAAKQDTISDLATIRSNASTGAGLATDVAANTTARHTHSNKSVLDAISEAPAPQSTTYSKTEVDTALSAKVSEPSSEGTSGQVLTTDGNGGRSWATVQGGGGEPSAYIKNAANSNDVLTLTKKDDTTVVLDVSDVAHMTSSALTPSVPATLTYTKTETDTLLAAKSPVISTSQPASASAYEIAYDTVTLLGTLTGSITITLATLPSGTACHIYDFVFTAGSTVPSITWPSGISWAGGSAPTLTASKQYEISIMNNLAAAIEY